MGLCANDSKRKRPFKTIIIPKGVINPNENNIIEIPMDLDATNNLIVKAATDANSCFSVEPFRGDLGCVQVVNHIVNPPDTSWVTDALRPRERTVEYVSQCLPRPQPSTSSYRPKSQDTSCQTCPAFQQSSTYLPEAHSPLCPICARASCKFFSNPGINSFNTNRFQFSCPATKTSSYTPYGSSYKPSCEFPKIPSNIRGEVLSRSKDAENEALNRLLDEKINKILKPMLLSLAKSSSDDEEKYMGACPAKSCSFVKPESYHRYEVEEDSDRSGQSYSDADFERFPPKKGKKSTSRSNIDVSETSTRPDCDISCYNQCPQKRTSFNFDKRNENVDVKKNEKNADVKKKDKNVGLNTAFLE